MPRIIVVAYEQGQSLDVFGPAEVFSTASRKLGRKAYEVVIASTAGGLVGVTAGTSISTTRLGSLRPRPLDTVLVVGGERPALISALEDRQLRAWIVRASRIVRRLGSVCSGCFILAACGVLDGRRCATHWSATTQLAARHPALQVDKDSIFVKDGTFWTSAGCTTGIDMALAMVEEDHGRALADAIAAELVLYVRRPGFQSQFSDALVAQRDSSDPLGESIAWARAHLRDIDVDRLARRAGLSVRTLHRRTAEVLSLTPAKLIERLRVEQARALLCSTTLLQKDIAWRTGFRDTARMQRALKRAYGVDGKTVRVMFANAA